MTDLNRKIKEETESVNIIYRGYDKKLLMQVDYLEKIISINKVKLNELIEMTKMTVQNLEYQRRMVAVARPYLKDAVLSLWADPDRGAFLPVILINKNFEKDTKQLKATRLNQEFEYQKIYLQNKRFRLKYFGLCIRKRE